MKKAKSCRNWKQLFKLIPGYDIWTTAASGDYFDAQAADQACDFFHECLTHIEGRFAGQPFVLEPFQQAVTGAIFGWKRADGTRRFREGFIYWPRGNGKTPWAGGILNYVLFCDDEPGAQIYGCAAEREQAALLFRHAKGQVENDPELSARADIFKGMGQRAIVLKDDPASGYKVLSSDAETKHGFAPHFVVCDELHAWKTKDLMDVFQTAFAKRARKQPFMLHITTADYDRDSTCNDKYSYACKVRDKVFSDSSFLPVIYEAVEAKKEGEQGDDWTDENVWKRVNPNWGVTVDPDSFKREFLRAKESPSYQNEFKRLHLNIRTTNAVIWIPLEQWDACKIDFAESEINGNSCYGGLDLSSTTDVSALALVFPQAEGFKVVTRFWVPEDNMRDRERRDGVPYSVWSRAGLIKATPGNRIDYDIIRADLNELDKRFDIRELAIDRWNATQLATQLMGDGFNIKEFGQGYKEMSAPSKEFDASIRSRELQHNGNACLRWMVGNACAEMDAAGNIKPSKKASADRIDGVVAMVMAIGRASFDQGGSVYNTRGLVTV